VTLDEQSFRGSSVANVRQTTAEITAGAVRAELARRRISGRDLATALGWSPSTTARRLNGQYPLNVDELAAIAEHIGVPVGIFLPDRDHAA
jgi:transcriptional regulator with XRE-family HTH domain